MVCVILVAQKKDRLFWNTLSEIVDRNFSVLHACERRLRLDRGDAELILTDRESFDTVQAGDAVIVFKEKMELDLDALAARRTIAVVDASNRELLAWVAAMDIPAITCGMSEKDTVTLSSMRADSAVVGFQRVFTRFGGAACEPQEFPVPLHAQTDGFALMAGAAICALCGKTVK